MRIITIDREFGSGGCELGKRLADALQIPCYDQEIIEEVAKMHGLDPNQVEHISESDVRTLSAGGASLTLRRCRQGKWCWK